MASATAAGTRTCIHCGQAVDPDRRLYCNNRGLPFRELAPGELLPPEPPWGRSEGHPRSAGACIGLIGLIGNLAIIVLGALFAAGEVLSPH